LLSSIHIENIALIKSIDIDFSRKFSAFTGETGAGKSIIIDSIGLICGAKASKEMIRAGEQSALVEAIFTELFESTKQKSEELGIHPDEDGCIFIQRTVTADGKGTVRVNGRQVPLSILKELSSYLINIHGQHDNQDLLKPEKHLFILDCFGETEVERATYSELYHDYQKIINEKNTISTDDREKQRRTEMLKFQIDEISTAKLKPSEEEKLIIEKKRINNLEKIALNVSTAYEALYRGNKSVTEGLEKAILAIGNLHTIIDRAPEYTEKLESMKYEIIDIAELLVDQAGDIEENPTEALNKIEGRLDLIYRLKQKYAPSVQQIIEFCEQAKKELSDIELSEIRLAELEKKRKAIKEKLLDAALALSNKRKEKAKKLSNEIENELQYLDMPNVKFHVDFSKNDTFCSYGNENVEFLISTNRGEPPKPLQKIASGGELSRIMLAIKSVIAEKDGVETLIFDEIDTGISGKTSRSIGIKLLQTATTCQVLCVTHSAQIASLANLHYLVSKKEKENRTETSIRKLSYEDRITEIARIIAGMDITDAARETAVELIENKNSEK